MSLSGWAQQDSTFKVKHPNEAKKAPKSAPVVKTTASPTASTSASKELQSVERQSAKPPAGARSGGPRTTGKGPALKPARSKTNPPINFGGTGGGKRAGTNQGSNPYKGRLRQKGHQ
jgi:ABC-type sugar transport system substrate-binding protein